MTTAPRVLVTLPQLPGDPASGAARTMSTIAEFLAQAGFTVRGLATTLSAGEAPVDLARVLAGYDPVRRTDEPRDGAPTIEVRRRGVEYVLQDVGDCAPAAWRARHGPQFDRLFDRELDRLRPDVLLTYGAAAPDVEHRRRARAAGARVVFGLFTTRYLSSGLGPHVDAVLTPSRFISERYREGCGIASTPLPTPVQLDDVLCPARTPARVTVVNPAIGKGAMLLARVAHTLGTEFPAIELEIVASRSSGRLLVQAGLAGGLDLRRHRNLHLRPAVTLPREIYGRTRVLLVASIAEEASARVVAEALLNGIPVIASEVGGLPENCAGGGFVLPLAPGLTERTRRPVSAEAARPWIDVIASLFAGDEAYDRASARARLAGERYDPGRVAGQYVDFFERVADGGSVAGARAGGGVHRPVATEDVGVDGRVAVQSLEHGDLVP